jgi:trk system potassium uptake protein TrkH
MPFVGSARMCGAVMALVVAGGLGFTVILNLLGLSGALWQWFRRRVRTRPLTEEEEVEEERREPVRVSLQTKIVLALTAALVFGGAFLIWVFERDNAFESMDGRTTLLACLFQSVTTRTAGFNTVDISALQPVTLYLMIFLMFIGASPGGTGGGIKTVTAAVLVRSVTALARGRSQVEFGRRSLPPEVASQATVVVVLSFLLVFLGSLVLTVSEVHLLRGDAGTPSSPFMAVLFEATSAFGTVGLSAGFSDGLTKHITDLGKVVLMGLMFLGRIGPLALVLAMGRKQSQSYEYPNERVMIG